MTTTIEGKAFVFGDNIDTDQIYPGRFLDETDVADVIKHAMEGADPHFVEEFRRGDLVVAGRNFGCGSSREHAAITLHSLGVSAVVARSFARIFYRNCINMGLPLIVCPELEGAVSKGDRVRLDLAAGTLCNVSTGATLRLEPISEYAQTILNAGGIKPLLRQRLAQESRLRR